MRSLHANRDLKFYALTIQQHNQLLPCSTVTACSSQTQTRQYNDDGTMFLWAYLFSFWIWGQISVSPHIGSTFMWQIGPMMQDFKGKGTGGSKHVYKWQHHHKKAQGTQVEGAGHMLRELYMFLSLHDSTSLLNPERAPHSLEMCRELQYIPSCAHVAVIKQLLLARRQLSTDLPIRHPLSCRAHWESWCRRCHTEGRWGQPADGLYCVFQQRNIT